MKKLLILFVAAVTLSSCSMYSTVARVSGSYKPLKEQVGTATFVLDLSNTKAVEYKPYNPFAKVEFQVDHEIGTIDERNRQAGEDYVRDWPEVRRQMENAFIDGFNRKSGKNGTKLVADGANLPYKVVFHVKYLDFGSTGANVADRVVSSALGGSFFGPAAGGCICEGTLDLIDTRSGQVVGTLKVKPFQTNGTFSETQRLCDLMETIAKDTAREAK